MTNWVKSRFARFTAVLLALLVGLFWLTDCRERPKVWRLGTNIWPGYEPLYLAREKGFLDKSVRLVEYPSASEVIRAFRNGNLELAALTLDEAINLHLSNIPVRVILVLDISHGADALLSRPEITKPEQLRGRKIGVEYNALGAYMLARFLEIHDMRPDEIKLVPVEVDRHAKVFSDQNLDAIITFDPVRTRLLKQGAHQLFTSANIPGEIVDVLVIRPSLLKKKRAKNVRKLRDAWYQSLDFLRAHPAEAREVMRHRLNLTPDEIKAAYDRMRLGDRATNQIYLSGDNPRLMPTLRKLGAVMLQYQLIKKEPDYSAFLPEK